MNITIIGAGNVGTNLRHAFALKGIRAELIHARDLLSSSIIHRTAVHRTSVFIYTVTDTALPSVISAVQAPEALHLHTSGTVPINVFGKDKPHAGVLYFFQSFSKTSLIDDWTDIPCFIEGRNADDLTAVRSIAKTLTERIYEAGSHDRNLLHIAGVFANNYTNLMYRLAGQVLQNTQIPFEALLPLIDRTAQKIHTISPAQAQTGPAQRNDLDIISSHLELLGALPDGNFTAQELQNTYRSLAELILRTPPPSL